MTIIWLHDDHIEFIITTKVATCIYQLFMCAIMAVMLNSNVITIMTISYAYKKSKVSYIQTNDLNEVVQLVHM